MLRNIDVIATIFNGYIIGQARVPTNSKNLQQTDPVEFKLVLRQSTSPKSRKVVNNLPLISKSTKAA